MAKIAFILLCHKDPDAIIAQAQNLTAAGDVVAIHFDARAPRSAFDKLKDAFADHAQIVFAKRRIKCGWGTWSLVQGSLLAVEAALEAFPDATHLYMLSGDCLPIKSAEYAHDFLDTRDVDYIEAFDFFRSDWIKTGIKEERLRYRHWFNERDQKRLFYGALSLQERLGLARKIPEDLDIQIGSQWWCLRRQTAEAILAFCAARRDIIRFFRTTWIPDETFFQTLVRHLVPANEIESRSLTFLMFSDYGMPVTFYNDHYEMLLGQDYLFARKISPEADRLRAQLAELYTKTDVSFDISNEGHALHRFLTGRGRVGRRFAPRFWEQSGALGKERELLIVMCKKWHVAKRLVAQIAKATNVPALEYVFNEESCDLPDLGGISSTMDKRHRHRRALVRMLFDHFETDRLVMCLDPAELDLVVDFGTDAATTRLLEIDCTMSDEFLAGHAARLGLLGAAPSADAQQRLLPTLRNELRYEVERLRDADLANHVRMSETSSDQANAAALAAFLSMSAEHAHTIAKTEGLFSD